MIPVCGVCGCEDVKLFDPLLTDPSLRHSFNGKPPNLKKKKTNPFNNIQQCGISITRNPVRMRRRRRWRWRWRKGR